jgi:hypothetical protein
MDRRTRRLVGCGLALAILLPGAGCRSMRSEVPPGRPFSPDGKQQPPIGFSSQPNPVDGLSGLHNTAPGTGASTGQLGMPSAGPSASTYGVPSGNFGPPGSSTLGQAPTGTGGANPSTALPQTGTGATGAAAGATTQPGGMPPYAP